jgi:hypothetical protein
MTAPRELPSVCAWCRRVRDPLDQRWITTALPQPMAGAANTHAICPDCLSAVLREARQARGA